MHDLRDRLVTVTLEWERAFGNAPAITSTLSEFDAAILLGLTLEEYEESMRGATAVQKGYDFRYQGKRYQVKGNRPSGKPGSYVTWVPKAMNYDWDCLVWILYDSKYKIEEAWLWDVTDYRNEFDVIKRLSPAHYRRGQQLR
ncbi:hypothetical protein D9M72_182160 [compost metagenome]